MPDVLVFSRFDLSLTRVEIRPNGETLVHTVPPEEAILFQIQSWRHQLELQISWSRYYKNNVLEYIKMTLIYCFLSQFKIILNICICQLGQRGGKNIFEKQNPISYFFISEMFFPRWGLASVYKRSEAMTNHQWSKVLRRKR